MRAPQQLEEPVCPDCEYVLVGLASRRCPECSCELGDDLSVYVPSRTGIVLDDWSPRAWSRAALRVLVLPFSPQAGTRMDRLSAGPALAFGALWTAACIFTYQIAKTLPHLALAISSSRSMRPVWASFVSSYSVVRGACWETWSIARWWILIFALSFGWLALESGHRAERGPARPIRAVILQTLLLAPWIAIIEWWSPIAPAILDPQVVAEPGTIFVSNWDWMRWAHHPWPIRGVAVALAAFAWARMVAMLRWPTALVVSLLATVLGLVASVFWSHLWVQLSSAGWPLLPILRP